MPAIKTVGRGLFLCALLTTLAACQTPPPAAHGLTDAQKAVLRQDGFVDTDEGWTLGILDKVLFPTDADTLNTDDANTVSKIGLSLQSAGITHVRVLGYTDATGTDGYNKALSLRRARAVRDALVKSGMNAANLQLVPLGKDNPVANNGTATGRAQNRRVAIVVLAE